MNLKRALVLLSTALVVAGVCFAQSSGTDSVSEEPVQKASLDGAKPAVPAQLPAAPSREALSPMKRGDILMARKMYREAIETYQEGIKNAAVTYNKIGIAHHQLMDFKTALRNYNRALRLDPTYSEALNNIGAVYYAQRNIKASIKQYQRALKYAPRSASILSNLGTAYFARRKYKDAFAAYQKAIDLDPDVFEHRSTAGSLLQERSVEERAKFHFYLAKTYARAGMTERALMNVRKALEEGFRDKRKFRQDPDFADLQENQEFVALLAAEYRVL